MIHPKISLSNAPLSQNLMVCLARICISSFVLMTCRTCTAHPHFIIKIPDVHLFIKIERLAK